MNIFSKKIKELRDEHYMTQAEFAKEIGVSDIALSYYETGRTTPLIDVIQRTCKRFDVSADWLLDTGKRLYRTNPSKRDTAEVLFNYVDCLKIDLDTNTLSFEDEQLSKFFFNLVQVLDIMCGSKLFDRQALLDEWLELQLMKLTEERDDKTYKVKLIDDWCLAVADEDDGHGLYRKD